MGLFDKMTGTRRPDSGVAPRSAEEVRAALLALNGPDVRFSVREDTSKERVGLVAECAVPEVRLTLKTRMRLVPVAHEVRTFDERWEGSALELSRGQYSRGQVTTVYRKWTYELEDDGRRHKVETFRFDPAEMKDPLRAAVLDAGWTWRGVLFRL
ncbi:hypothetical protein ACFQ7N_03390 [Streptomyces niveus]|uniref:hypothetical protein n=1 Tax=Streptomyces niveus TaxID=193462 RepID=UPI0036A3F725